MFINLYFINLMYVKPNIGNCLAYAPDIMNY